MFIGRIVKDTYSSADMNFPRFEEGLIGAELGTSSSLLHKTLKRTIKPGADADAREDVIYYPIYLDYGADKDYIDPTTEFANYFTYTDATYQSAVNKLGGLFIYIGSTDMPYYLSYVEGSDPRGLYKIWSDNGRGGFARPQYRNIFRIFARTSTNRSTRYDIVTNSCFNTPSTGCINKERDFMLVNLVNATGAQRTFDQIVVGPEISDAMYNRLVYISASARPNSYRFKPSDQILLDRTTAGTTSQKNLVRQFLGPQLIVNYSLYETNLIAVDITDARGSGATKIIKDNTTVPPPYLRVNNFSGTSSAKVYYYDNLRAHDLGKDDSFPSRLYTNLYLRKMNGATLQYYPIVSSLATLENNPAKTVWKVKNANETEFIFVHLKLTGGSNLNATRGDANSVGEQGRISRWESDDTVSMA